MVIIFGILLIFIIVGGYFGIRYAKNKEQEQSEIEEYIPEQEITEEQARQTIVSLYFVERETGNLLPEARLIDIKDLMNNTYNKLMELLIGGPKNDKLNRVIPENTKLLGVNIEGDCLVLDMSGEFLMYDKEDKNAKDNMIYSIVNTMTELTEVNQVKFLIDGKVNDEFKDVFVRK